MLKFAIVSDNKTCQKLKEILAKCAKDWQTQICVDSFFDGDEIASDYKSVWDVIILDCNLKRMDGFVSAKYIRTLDKQVPLCFVANDASQALIGYTVQASAFWLRPLQAEQINRDLHVLVKNLLDENREFLKVNTEYGIHKLELGEIVYIESMNHKLIVHAQDAEYTLKSTMGAMEDLLIDKGFFRCNQGYLVNLAHVKGIEGDFALVGKTKLAISRGRKKAFLNTYFDFVQWLVQLNV